MSCKCPSPLTFDVVTKKCITKCTGSALCLDCSQIPYTVGSAIKYDSKSSNVKAVTDGDKIGSRQYPTTSTNYNTIKAYMCPCATDYYWDVNRAACISGNVY